MKSREKINSKLLIGFFLGWSLNVVIIPTILASLYQLIGPGIFDGLAGSSSSTQSEREIGSTLLGFVFPIAMVMSFAIVAYFSYKLYVVERSHKAMIMAIFFMTTFAAVVTLLIAGWKVFTT